MTAGEVKPLVLFERPPPRKRRICRAPSRRRRCALRSPVIVAYARCCRAIYEPRPRAESSAVRGSSGAPSDRRAAIGDSPANCSFSARAVVALPSETAPIPATGSASRNASRQRGRHPAVRRARRCHGSSCDDGRIYVPTATTDDRSRIGGGGHRQTLAPRCPRGLSASHSARVRVSVRVLSAAPARRRSHAAAAPPRPARRGSIVAASCCAGTIATPSHPVSIASRTANVRVVIAGQRTTRGITASSRVGSSSCSRRVRWDPPLDLVQVDQHATAPPSPSRHHRSIVQ